MDRPSAEGILYKLYDKVDGYAISKKARSKLSYFYKAHVYGEVDFHAFYDILSLTNPQPNEIFYDLGSGTGKAVALASLAFPFKKCVGVEKLEDLYLASVDIMKQLNRSNIKFIHHDFSEVDFSDGDIIYLNSYFFGYDMYNQSFIQKIKLLKLGTRLIFVHTPLNIPQLSLIEKTSYLFSWGNATVYIMQKI